MGRIYRLEFGGLESRSLGEWRSQQAERVATTFGTGVGAWTALLIFAPVSRVVGAWNERKKCRRTIVTHFCLHAFVIARLHFFFPFLYLFFNFPFYFFRFSFPMSCYSFILYCYSFILVISSRFSFSFSFQLQTKIFLFCYRLKTYLFLISFSDISQHTGLICSSLSVDPEVIHITWTTIKVLDWNIFTQPDATLSWVASGGVNWL